MSNNKTAVLPRHRIAAEFLGPSGLRNTAWIWLFAGVLVFLCGCGSPERKPPERTLTATKGPKLFVVILDALKRKTLMESLDTLPNFKAVIKGDSSSYPYIYFENVLVSIPSSSKPSNATLLTGVYPLRHGVPSTIWFDRKTEKTVTLSSLSQRRVIKILEKTDTHTIFDYARRSGKTTMAVATQVAKGVDSRDWIKQGIHVWSHAFWINLFTEGITMPDGGHLDKRTTAGLFSGYKYCLSDGLKARLRLTGDIPDLVVVHYVGMDIFTHYPRRFMTKESWTIDQIQKWYLRQVLDPELGKIVSFLEENRIFENTIFFFVSDHGQTRIRRHIDEKKFEKDFFKTLGLTGPRGQREKTDIIVMPGAGTKVMYVRNRTSPDWMPPPRLIEDVKPAVDALVDMEDVKRSLNALLVAKYPGERDKNVTGARASDRLWFFDLGNYRQSQRRNDDFIAALRRLSKLDELVGEELKVAYMYCRDFGRENMPDIILVSKPGYSFVPDKKKYAHHGGIYAEDAYVSFVISGPAAHLFSNRPQTITRQIDTVDLVPTAAHLAGIKIDRPIDGKDRLPQVN
jgi:hypothetical protein